MDSHLKANMNILNELYLAGSQLFYRDSLIVAYVLS